MPSHQPILGRKNRSAKVAPLKDSAASAEWPNRGADRSQHRDSRRRSRRERRRERRHERWVERSETHPSQCTCSAFQCFNNLRKWVKVAMLSACKP